MRTAKPVSEYIRQFVYTVKTYPRVLRFIKQFKLWEGVDQYGWFSKLLLVVAIVVGFVVMGKMISAFSHTSLSNPFAAMSALGSAYSELAQETVKHFGSGLSFYVQLILVQVLIFHFTVRTLQVLTGEKKLATFDEFVKSQIRTVKVSFRALIWETITSAFVKLFFNIFSSADFLEPLVLLLVVSYFLGYIVLDNYYEHFDMNISESAKFTHHFAGVAIGVGIIVKLLLSIPLIGTIIVPLFTGVLATLVMYELSDLHLIGKKSTLQTEEYV